MQTELRRLEQHVQSHWFRDGLGEMVGGLVFILLGVYFAVVEYLGDTSMLGGLLQAGLILVLLGLAYLGRRVMLGLKAKYVVPRAGFVEYRVDKERQSSRRIGAAALAAVIAALMVLSIPMPSVLNWLVVITGFLVGLMLVFAQARMLEIRRFYLYAAISFLLGILGGLSGFSDGYALGIYYGAMGLVFVAAGLFVWQRFLKDNPLPEPGDEA